MVFAKYLQNGLDLTPQDSQNSTYWMVRLSPLYSSALDRTGGYTRRSVSTPTIACMKGHMHWLEKRSSLCQVCARVIRLIASRRWRSSVAKTSASTPRNETSMCGWRLHHRIPSPRESLRATLLKDSTVRVTLRWRYAGDSSRRWRNLMSILRLWIRLRFTAINQEASGINRSQTPRGRSPSAISHLKDSVVQVRIKKGCIGHPLVVSALRFDKCSRLSEV
jgi:hypothetical protein